ALKFHVAEPLNAAVEPSTEMVWPTKLNACVDCAVFCNDTSELNWSLAFNCCSTWANCTSCAVNWLVSSGSSGFWFCNCVVSSVRNVWKLSAIPVVAVLELLLLDDEPVVVAGAGADVTGVDVVASTDMAFPQMLISTPELEPDDRP